MSSIDISKIAAAGSSLVTLGMKLLKGTTFTPGVAAINGFISTFRFLAYTTLGRAIVLVVLLIGTFGYFKSHFTAMERGKWEQAVQKKQEIIENKVSSINAETKKAQEMARMQAGFLDRIVAVVVDGIWKVQAPHPIESETIDLINETRNTPKKK